MRLSSANFNSEYASVTEQKIVYNYRRNVYDDIFGAISFTIVMRKHSTSSTFKVRSLSSLTIDLNILNKNKLARGPRPITSQ